MRSSEAKKFKMLTQTLNTVLLALVPLILPASAQNNTTNSTCTNQVRAEQLENGYVNSTASVSISWPEPWDGNNVSETWHLSVLVNDTRNNTIHGQDPTGWDIDIQAYLSVENSVRNTTICVYQFSAQNATSTGDHALDFPRVPMGSIGCAGVFSDDCTAYLVKALQNSSVMSMAANRCPTPWSNEEDRQRRRDACGEDFQPNILCKTFPLVVWCGEELMISAMPRIDVTQRNCSLPSPPGVEDLGDEYTTFSIGGNMSPYLSPGWNDHANDSLTYDLAVNQAIPFVIAGTFREPDSDRITLVERMICITPNNTESGSRVPESKTPWRDSDSSVDEGPGQSSSGAREKASRVLTLAMASMLGAFLAL